MSIYFCSDCISTLAVLFLLITSFNAFLKEFTEIFTSSSVVAQEQTLILITLFPLRDAPPTQHSLNSCILAIVLSVMSSVSQQTSTWLYTTSLTTVNPFSAFNSSAN